MTPSETDLTQLKPPSKRTFSRWRSAGLGFSACVAVTCLGSLPARALNLNLSTWTGAATCTDPASNCVDNPGGDNYSIVGSDIGGQSYTISQTATADTFISFNYQFAPVPLAAYAGYSLDGITYTPLAEAAISSSTGPLLLTSGNTFSFQLINNGEQSILEVSNFSATPVSGPAPTAVPGPLPLLGVVIAFGWVRRLRARCKGTQLNR